MWRTCFFLFRFLCERVVFAGIGGLASGQEPQTVEKFFLSLPYLTSGLTCSANDSGSRHRFLKRICFCSEVLNMANSPPPTDAHLPRRCDSTATVGAQTATRSPLLLLLITTIATSVSAGQCGCACICCHRFSFKRFESLASPHRLTLFSLSNL